MWLPIDTENGTVQNGVYTVTFGGYTENRFLYWISLTGPASSVCNVFIDTTFIDTTARGDFNRADYYEGIPLARGRQVILRWNTATGVVPQVSIGTTDENGPQGVF